MNATLRDIWFKIKLIVKYPSIRNIVWAQTKKEFKKRLPKRGV